MALSEIKEQQIIERIIFENPWWNHNSIDTFYDEMKRRLYFNVFFPHIVNTEVKRAVVLMGPRRVGKTVMIFHSIQKLIQRGI
ncbi:MAG: ATP-binding protein, partial [Bacteroidota bacterium]